MKIVQFIIIVIVLGWLLSPAHFTGSIVYAMDPPQVENDYIIAPNVFTPNGDGENDFFIVKSSNDQQIVLLNIYTRAGVLIFTIEARTCVWDGYSIDGRKMSNGVYYYTAEVRGSSPKVSKVGFVHLFR